MANASLLPQLPSHDLCCGCGACAARCPHACISMRPDASGFMRPEVNADACASCCLCESVCPVLAHVPQDARLSVCWGVTSDTDLLERSSSGGLFGLLAHLVLSQGGLIAGAAWSQGCREVRHVIIEDEKSLDQILRSKYVQSTVGAEVYAAVRQALLTGRRVLFSGTACQVAGIRAYLGKLAASELLLTIDIICHGVPSPALWSKWVAHIEATEQGKLLTVNQRDKQAGWLLFSARYDLQSNEGALTSVITPFTQDWYMRAFLANASIRPSCFRCPAKQQCGSDITLGDYWGIGSKHPEVDSANGVSAIVVHSNAGMAALDSVKDHISWGTSTFENVTYGNPPLVRSAQPYHRRAAFMADVERGMGAEELMRRWDFEPTVAQRLASLGTRVKKKLIRTLRRLRP